MSKYLKYAKFLLKHKYYVLIESFKLGIPIRGLLHDLSKFRPSEFFVYADYYYGGRKPVRLVNHPTILHKYHKSEYTQEDLERDLDIAWLKHQHRNKHHWQHWILKNDDGSVTYLDMPKKYIKEMVADWVGAGKAINGKNEDSYAEVWHFYIKNYNNIKLSKRTEEILLDLFYDNMNKNK